MLSFRTLATLAAAGFMLAAQPVLARSSSKIRIATWNMSWLTDRLPGTGGPGGVPSDVHRRTAADLALLRKYARRLNADIVAFQEVDGVDSAKKVFSPARYDLHSTSEPDVQKPGFAIRKGIRFVRNPDFEALDIIADEPRSLRRGADITVFIGEQPVRMLAVHLKSGCPEQSLESHSDSCSLLHRQLPILRGWIADRVNEGVPFVVLGDFNRAFDDSEEFWRNINLDGSAGLLRSTAGRTSPCWAGKHPKFIDHIVFGGPARDWVDAKSFNVIVYDETDPSFEKRISDHCPQRIDIRPPRKRRHADVRTAH